MNKKKTMRCLLNANDRIGTGFAMGAGFLYLFETYKLNSGKHWGCRCNADVICKGTRFGSIHVTILSLLLGALIASAPLQAQYSDRIVAVVEDDVILDSELYAEMVIIKQRISENNMQMPPDNILRKQILERIIIDKLQRQLAVRSGIRISEEMLNESVNDIARGNGMSLGEFRSQLESQGIRYQDFVENVRNEIIINQLRAHEIGERVKVTDREVAHYLETHGKVGNDQTQYHLGHILVAIPEGASATEIQNARAKAEQIIKRLREGQDFKQTAIAVSDGGQALKGGDLGWRSKGQLPTLFVDYVVVMGAEDVSDPIRSPSGFHIIKMLELSGEREYMVTQTKVRHILIKTNELVDDREARRRLNALKSRIADGDEFAVLARSHSDDKGSAIQGGSLEWVASGALVPPFEAAMNQLAIGEISDPVQTQFGWHLIQVLDRKEEDNSEDFKKNQVRDEIRKRKIEEETELWLRRLRDEAYVDIRINTSL